MSSTNGRCNTNERGSSKARRARKLWLLSPESGHGGNGIEAPCWECTAPVTYETMSVDRIIPGVEGGRYTRDNIRVHCKLCSSRQGQRMTMLIIRGRDPQKRLALVKTLTLQGRTAPEIAAVIGCTARTVQRDRTRAGVAQYKPPPLTDDERRAAEEVLDDGGSLAEAARTAGRSFSAISRAFPGRGWTREQCGDFTSTLRRYRGVVA